MAKIKMLLSSGKWLAILAGTILLGLCASVNAENFPNGPIEVINNSKPGGGTDIFLRFATEEAAKILGTDLLVKSKTGGVATNALKYVNSKPKDGHTVFSLLSGHLLTIMRGKVDMTLDDIVPLVRGTIDPQFVVVKAGKYADAAAFIKAAKSGSIKQGGTKVGGNAHVAALLFANKIGMAKQTYVPFQKSGEIVLNLASGRIDVSLLNYDEFESQLEAGEVTALAVLSPKRVKTVPNVPTGHEVGISLNSAATRGLGVLKGTPEPVIEKLEAAFLKSMNSEGYLKYLAGSGQTAESIAGRETWTAQIQEMYSDYQAIAAQVKLIKK